MEAVLKFLPLLLQLMSRSSEIAGVVKQGIELLGSIQRLLPSSGGAQIDVTTGRGVQEGLTRLGYYSGPIDTDVRTDATRAAVTKFQQAWNAAHPSEKLAVDGWIGVKTQTALATKLAEAHG